MILGGDELGHTQQGNNNAYCQDNEISWLDWDLDEERERFLESVARIIQLRRQHPVFSRRRYVQRRCRDRGGPRTRSSGSRPTGAR